MFEICIVAAACNFKDNSHYKNLLYIPNILEHKMDIIQNIVYTYIIFGLHFLSSTFVTAECKNDIHIHHSSLECYVPFIFYTNNSVVKS